MKTTNIIIFHLYCPFRWRQVDLDANSDHLAMISPCRVSGWRCLWSVVPSPTVVYTHLLCYLWAEIATTQISQWCNHPGFQTAPLLLFNVGMWKHRPALFCVNSSRPCESSIILLITTFDFFRPCHLPYLRWRFPLKFVLQRINGQVGRRAVAVNLFVIVLVDLGTWLIFLLIWRLLLPLLPPLPPYHLTVPSYSL